MNILGISALYHDSAACLVRDGNIIAAAQEERFTRKKHDNSVPVHAMAYCLSAGGIEGRDLDYVAFYDKPFLKLERILETYLACAPLGIRSFLKAMPPWIKQKLWIKDVIKQELDFEGTVIFPEHHESHAASAFFPSPFEKAAFLTIDGVGEWSTTSYGIGANNNIQVRADISFPHSAGLLYSAFTYYTGFRVNSGEYKVMGLAPYGEAKYKDIILKELIDLKEDGSFKLNTNYFNFISGLTMTNRKFNRLFGGPRRKPESQITQKDMDVARSIQEVTEEIFLRMGRHIRKETKLKNLCLAGGVALNCVANGKLLREGIFDNIWVQPAAGDAGGALGAALFTWYQYLENKRTANGTAGSMKGSYLGPEYSTKEIEKYLNENNIPYSKPGQKSLAGTVARLLAQGNIVGWFQGRMEFGPRALGARSILGDARNPEMQQRLNLKIKFRESFRPFAPSVLAERAADYFVLNRESPYMNLTAPVKKERQRVIPAVTHVDYSARVQTVHKETNKLYHELLSQFDKKYGCPVIVNTSFNVRGEPIVCTPEDAYRCFMHTGMDYLCIGDFLVDKKEIKYDS
ncbi:MAG: carbamoyltransferase [bacterium]|nr:carbamoyltransferase [bacterium]